MLEEQTIIQLESARILAEVIAFETDEVAKSACGDTILAYGGNEYIDFTSGVAVNSVGHNHPEVSDAIADQCRRVTHISDTMRHTPQLELAHWMQERLQTDTQEPWSILLLNSGSESIDAAAKLALKATGRTRFVAFEGAFHGRTLFGTLLSHSKAIHSRAYEPFLALLQPQILRAPAPRCRGCTGVSVDDCCAAGFASLIESAGDDIAAVFLEPMQGEGGYRPFSAQAAARIEQIARDRGILLIADEVQSGWGRTGKWFAFQHLGIEPDIVVFGKAVGGGLPLAGIAARRPLMQRWETGEHGTTFGGNPLSCAAGLAALRVVERDGLVERAATLGASIRARLAPLMGRHGVVDVRGLGLMIGIELRTADGRPDWPRCSAIKSAAADAGLLVLTCGAKMENPRVDNATIRLLPALNVADETLDRGLTILENAIMSTG